MASTPQPQHARNPPGLIRFYSVLPENLPILTTETCKTFIIASFPFEWKGTLMVKAPTVNMSLLLIPTVNPSVCLPSHSCFPPSSASQLDPAAHGT